MSSTSTLPMFCGCMVLDTIAPTATSDRPSDAALSLSTRTEMKGRDADRLLVTWLTSSRSLRLATTASVASCSVDASGAVTSTSMSVEPKPPLPPATVISPTSGIASTVSCTS